MTYNIIATSYAGTLDALDIRTGHASRSSAMAALVRVSGCHDLTCKRGGDGEYYVYGDAETMDRDDDDSAAIAVIVPEGL